MNITSKIEKVEESPERFTVGDIIYNAGVYNMHGGNSHDGDFVITCRSDDGKLTSLYFNSFSDEISSLNIQHYSSSRHYFTKSNEKITLTFSN